MKGILTGLCVLAIANLLAIGGFVGWLKFTDRLDADRVRKIREVLAPTIADEKAKAAEEAAKAEVDKKVAIEKAKHARPPLTAEQQLTVRLQASEAEQQRTARLRSEAEALQAGLIQERQKIEAAADAYKKQKADFERTQKETQELVGSAQFKKAVSVLAGLKASEAKAALMPIMSGQALTVEPPAPKPGNAPVLQTNGSGAITPPAAPTTGRNEKGMLQTVAYLDALDERLRNKIMAEFVKDDPTLAAVLLERLRTHGVLTRADDATLR
jgi:hypothetical protein